MSGAEERTFVVVGAGQAGAWVARTLRAEGHAGRIVLIGAESHLPYERPPLSKDVLSGKSEPSSAALLTRSELGELRIEFRQTAATAIDRAAGMVACADGTLIGYDHLFLTTGSRPRCLPASVAPGSRKRLHTLRTLDDAADLKDALANSRRLAVIGGGWIGLEVAATARQLDLDVTVIEAADGLCSRSVPPVVSELLASLHRRRGVAVMLGRPVRDLSADDSKVMIGVGDEILEVDHAVIGIGVLPDTELAAAAGLAIDDGVVVDECGRTSDMAISAAGDVTSQPSTLLGGRQRLESWANAQNQAIVAAKAALGLDARHSDVPWIWSDQYEMNIQIIGAPERGATFYYRGNPARDSGCILSMDAEGIARGAVAFNAPRDLRLVRRALEQNAAPDISTWHPLATDQ